MGMAAVPLIYSGGSVSGSIIAGVRRIRRGPSLCGNSLFVSGHGFNRAVTAAKSTRLQPLRAWLFSCHADSSAPALRPVAQPFLAVRLWSAGNPLTASFATFRFPATRLPCLPRACLPQAGFEGSEVEGPLFFVFSPLATALHNRWPSAGFRREPVVFFQTMSPAS